jgi:hypothetical protein
MTNADAWAILVGAAMPVVISALKSAAWPTKAKFLLAVVVCAVAGAGTAYFAGQLSLTWERALVDVAIVFTSATAVYKLWFEDTEIDKRLTGS